MNVQNGTMNMYNYTYIYTCMYTYIHTYMHTKICMYKK